MVNCALVIGYLISVPDVIPHLDVILYQATRDYYSGNRLQRSFAV